MLDNIKELINFSKTLKVLYVEDNQSVREQTLKLFENFFTDITIAVDGKDGLDKFIAGQNRFDMIFSDINMPNMDGIEMLKKIKEVDKVIPFIIFSAHNETTYFLDSIKLGADGYIIKPIDMSQFIDILSKSLKHIKSIKDNSEYKLNLEKSNQYLELEVKKRTEEIRELNNEILETQKEVIFKMGVIAEGRSRETGAHVRRVAEYSKLLAKLYGLSDLDSELLKQASPMHDIGKVAIPDEILNKPGILTSEEYTVMKTHAEVGYDMLKNSTKELLKLAATVAHEHHEKWDGTGYPRGLKGEDINIAGRITAVADVFDGLGSNRVYKAAWPDEKIFDLLRSESGKHFEPKLIDIFFDNIEEFLAIRNRYEPEKLKVKSA